MKHQLALSVGHLSIITAQHFLWQMEMKQDMLHEEYKSTTASVQEWTYSHSQHGTQYVNVTVYFGQLQVPFECPAVQAVKLL